MVVYMKTVSYASISFWLLITLHYVMVPVVGAPIYDDGDDIAMCNTDVSPLSSIKDENSYSQGFLNLVSALSCTRKPSVQEQLALSLDYRKELAERARYEAKLKEFIKFAKFPDYSLYFASTEVYDGFQRRQTPYLVHQSTIRILSNIWYGLLVGVVVVFYYFVLYFLYEHATIEYLLLNILSLLWIGLTRFRILITTCISYGYILLASVVRITRLAYSSIIPWVGWIMCSLVYLSLWIYVGLKYAILEFLGIIGCSMAILFLMLRKAYYLLVFMLEFLLRFFAEQHDTNPIIDKQRDIALYNETRRIDYLTFINSRSNITTYESRSSTSDIVESNNTPKVDSAVVIKLLPGDCCPHLKPLEPVCKSNDMAVKVHDTFGDLPSLNVNTEYEAVYDADYSNMEVNYKSDSGLIYESDEEIDDLESSQMSPNRVVFHNQDINVVSPLPGVSIPFVTLLETPLELNESKVEVEDAPRYQITADDLDILSRYKPPTPDIPLPSFDDFDEE